jgi:hypothetical protein
MNPQPSPSLLRSAAACAATLLLLVLAPPAFAGKSVELKQVTHEYATSPPHFDTSFQLAMLDAGWLPLTVAAGDITAEGRLGDRSAKVRIQFADGKATFTLLESTNLGQETCAFNRGTKLVRGACINQAYYDWIESIMTGLPAAHARIALVKALAAERR